MMTKGDTIQVDGYDVQARLTSLSGEVEVLVMLNNSTHYLVATRSIMFDGPARFEESFRYADSRGQFQPAGSTYLRALEHALTIVGAR